MRKVFVSVYELTEGFEMAETIFNEYGAEIVSENTILDEHIIKKLRNLGISKVKIFDTEHNTVSANNSELFKAQYNQNIENVKEILHYI